MRQSSHTNEVSAWVYPCRRRSLVIFGVMHSSGVGLPNGTESVVLNGSALENGQILAERLQAPDEDQSFQRRSLCCNAAMASPRAATSRSSSPVSMRAPSATRSSLSGAQASVAPTGSDSHQGRQIYMIERSHGTLEMIVTNSNDHITFPYASLQLPAGLPYEKRWLFNQGWDQNAMSGFKAARPTQASSDGIASASRSLRSQANRIAYANERMRLHDRGSSGDCLGETHCSSMMCEICTVERPRGILGKLRKEYPLIFRYE